MFKLNLLLVGCGKMGHALLTGWKKNNIIENCHVIDPELKDSETISAEVFYHASVDMIDPNFIPDVVVFAVKPQIMDIVIPPYQKYVTSKTIFLSIAAGKNTPYFEHQLGGHAKIIRAMPNTPAAIGKGITVAYPNQNIQEVDKESIFPLLQAVGVACWIEDESYLDAVTAVSGSGPAYLFYLIETMAQAGIESGLSPSLAQTLARQTVVGSAALVENMSETTASTLRENVTSPGGTTAAALEVLMKDKNGLQSLMNDAIEAAVERSKKLSA